MSETSQSIDDLISIVLLSFVDSNQNKALMRTLRRLFLLVPVFVSPLLSHSLSLLKPCIIGFGLTLVSQTHSEYKWEYVWEWGSSAENRRSFKSKLLYAFRELSTQCIKGSFVWTHDPNEVDYECNKWWVHWWHPYNPVISSSVSPDLMVGRMHWTTIFKLILVKIPLKILISIPLH